MDVLKFITCGSVDDGKSTLIGRLLWDSEAVSLDIREAIERQRKHNGQETVELALLTDGLRAEREQGITIDVAYKYFTTKKRKFIIADAPGHIQYTRNMITAASNADVAIVLIDARFGVVEQTVRHTLLASLLNLTQIVVAVNKMDLVGYEEAIFEQIKTKYLVLTNRLKLPKVTFIPMSAKNGDNVVAPSKNIIWYKGETLLNYLENIPIIPPQTAESRFQVQYVIRPQGSDYRGYAGRIQSGVYRKGDKILVLPSDLPSEIVKIEENLQEVETAIAGQSVVLHLKDNIDISRGDSIVVQGATVEVGSQLQAYLCWFDEKQALTNGARLLLQNGSNTVKVIVQSIDYQLDISTLEKIEVEKATLNAIVKVRLRTAQPIVFDTYNTNRQTGSFVLVHPNNHHTVAAGMIVLNENE
jgi:sulfate adenylyltransferase subunit 1